MSDQQRQLSLNAFIYPAGHHESAWRHPLTSPERLFDVDYFQEIARTAEAAKLDALFFADGPALRSDAGHGAAGALEPITLLTAIAAVTERIGLIATASTTYFEPYNLARLFASLDHISKGRAGWNIVTTGTDLAAANFGLSSHPDHADRYARAREFVDATVKLWDSWEDDAIVLDTDRGVYADTSKIHEINYVGRHLRVRGPFNAPRSPQGYPVLVQAGASNEGRSFAGQYAEAIFTAHQRLSDGQAFYADIKRRASQFGRNPDHVKILPGISPFIGDTEAQARDLEREFNELTSPEYGLAQLEHHRNSGAPPRPRCPRARRVVRRRRRRDGQPAEPVAGGRRHRAAGASDAARTAASPRGRARTPSVRGDAGAGGRHHRRMVHPGRSRRLQRNAPYYPGGLDVFAEKVVPILQERGLFRTEYSGTTLRDHFGLERPASQYAQTSGRVAL